MAKRRQKPRNTYTYVFKDGKKIVHKGQTEDLEQREQQHKQKWPKGRIVKIGKAKTKDGALEWEKKKGFSRGKNKKKKRG